MVKTNHLSSELYLIISLRLFTIAFLCVNLNQIYQTNLKNRRVIFAQPLSTCFSSSVIAFLEHVRRFWIQHPIGTYDKIRFTLCDQNNEFFFSCWYIFQ